MKPSELKGKQSFRFWILYRTVILNLAFQRKHLKQCVLLWELFFYCIGIVKSLQEDGYTVRINKTTFKEFKLLILKSHFSASIPLVESISMKFF